MKTWPIYSVAQIRAMEQALIHQGTSGWQLMQQAAQAAWQQLRQRYPQAGRLQIFCGAGNNAGDGYALAAIAHQQGVEVQVLYLHPPDKLHGEAAQAVAQARYLGVRMALWSSQTLEGDVIVDALLGIGLTRPITGDWHQAIAAINDSPYPVMALDIPSGLDADTGCQQGIMVKAHTTITFIGGKQGLYTGEASQATGDIVVAPLGADQLPMTNPAAYLYQPDPLPKRLSTAHKGQMGRVLIAGGDYGMAGAVALASKAALYCGAGLIRALTRPEHAFALAATQPEIMYTPWHQDHDPAHWVEQADVVILGPGLGQNSWSKKLFDCSIQGAKSLVIDADALHLLAQSSHKLNHQAVLTPHPGEAAVLLGMSVDEVQSNRFEAVAALQQRYGVVVVLKGPGSIVADGQQQFINTTGNPGMATAGMGDVLSGVIGALIAQGMSAGKAACSGVYWHGAAADQGAKQGQRGLHASELLQPLRQQVNG